jgi:hypothetical protein
MLDIFKWKTWVIILVVIIAVVWLIWGGKKHEFVGLAPLMERHEYVETRLPEPIQSETRLAESPYEEITSVETSPSKKSVGEQLVLQALQELFPSQRIQSGIRPHFLVNPESGRRLELDCYLPNLRLAVEYNGKQHYEFPNVFHKTEADFIDQIYRDNLKKSLCEQNDILLVVVPYYVDMCIDNGDQRICKTSVKRETRYTKILDYLYNVIMDLRS